MNWSEIIQIALVALCPIMMIFCFGRMIFGGKGGSCGSDEPKEGEQRTQTLRKERSEQEVK
jgi:hypothetical protein